MDRLWCAVNFKEARLWAPRTSLTLKAAQPLEPPRLNIKTNCDSEVILTFMGTPHGRWTCLIICLTTSQIELGIQKRIITFAGIQSNVKLTPIVVADLGSLLPQTAAQPGIA